MSLRARLKQPSPAFGSWIAIGHPLSAELMGRAGYDCVIFDAQHGGLSEPQLLPLLQALDAAGTPALVRVNWLDPALIMRAADLGAAGVVVPMVNTPDEARTAVEAIRYPPHGIRSFGPIRPVSEEPLCIVMIETIQALDNLDAIAAVHGLDGLLVGPADLAISMGLGLSPQMPAAVLDAIEKVAAACRTHDLIAASFAFDPTNAAELAKRGVGLLALGSDSLFIRRGAAQELEQLRQLCRAKDQ